MGVRESVAQQPEEMRLQEMTIEAHEKEPLVFDIEQEVSPAEWEEIANFVKDCRKRNNWYEFAWWTATMKPVNPELVKSFNLDDEVAGKLKKQTRDRVGGVNKTNVAQLLNAEIIFPGIIEKERLIQDQEWQEMIEQVKNEYKTKDWDGFLNNAANIKTLSLEHAKEIPMDDKAWEGIRKTLEERYQKQGIIRCCSMMATAKILFPGRFSKIKPDKKAWQEMKDELEEKRQEGVTSRDFLAMLYTMQILAAKEVIIDENGLRLVMPEKTGDFKEKKLERPMRKSF